MIARTTGALFLVLLLAGGTMAAQPIDRTSWPIRTERSRTYDVVHYRIELDLDDAAKTMHGKVTIRISPLSDDFRTCAFDAERLTVTGAFDETGNRLGFDQTDGSVVVTLLKGYGYDDTLSVVLEYVKRQAPLDASAYGMAPSYEIGLNFLDETTEHPALIQTIGFPTGARHWFPCYDYPNDKATQEVIATVREDYQVLSNGKLLGVTHDRSKKRATYHWYQDQPHSTYLSIVFAGPYVVLRDSLRSIPVNYWVYPKDVRDAMRSFHRTPEILEFFESIYGVPYPWDKYDQITIPGIGGGQENTSATSLGQSTIHDEKAEKDFPSHWLVAHEAAHQWWGDLITLRDWSQTWLNESFATYGEYMYSRHSLGEEEGALNLEEKKNTYLREAKERYIRPIVSDRWNFPADNFDRHAYQKGSIVLHMLRDLLGDAGFFRVHAYFLKKHAFQPVDTHDFQIAVKEVTGRNLDWFFEQWIYRPGHPVFDVSYRWDKAQQHIVLRVEQVQDSTSGIPVFRVPVSVALVTSRGKTSHPIWINKGSETFELPCTEPPLLVRFDEKNVLLKELRFAKSKTELLYQLAHDDVIGKMWAADQLSAMALDRDIIAGLQQAAMSDRFWGVRRNALWAMQAAKKEFSGFFEKMCTDKHPSVRTAALAALGDLKERGRVPFFVDRFQRDDSYRAQAEALRAIGKSGDLSRRQFLTNALPMKSPHNILAQAAGWALRELEQESKGD